MNVVAKRTPPPKARSPNTKRFPDRKFDPLLLVNQSNFKDKSKGKQPTTIEIANRLTIVIIFALKTTDESSKVSFGVIFPNFFISNLNEE